MRLSVIAAVAANGVIGRNGNLPWYLPADLRHFKELTLGHTMIMGRKTFESIGRALPHRRSVVLSRDPGYRATGVEVVSSFAAALATGDDREPFAIGGATIYRLALPLARDLHLTRLHRDFQGDVRFPALEMSEWTLVSEEPHRADGVNHYGYSFLHYTRRRGPDRNG
jgi:dihydrofolate reductase